MPIRINISESNIKVKTFKINENIEKQMKEYNITSTTIRDLVKKHIQNLQEQAQNKQYQSLMSL